MISRTNGLSENLYACSMTTTLSVHGRKMKLMLKTDIQSNGMLQAENIWMKKVKNIRRALFRVLPNWKIKTETVQSLPTTRKLSVPNCRASCCQWVTVSITRISISHSSWTVYSDKQKSCTTTTSTVGCRHSTISVEWITGHRKTRLIKWHRRHMFLMTNIHSIKRQIM